MQTISKAGRAWLANHGVSTEWVRGASFCSGQLGPYVSFADDPWRPKQRGFYRDILLEREGRWLLQTEAGSAYYEEHRNGHALLVCRGTVLPQNVCAALYRSYKPLNDVVELPEGAVILAGKPTVVRAEAKRGGTHLLLRVEREPLPEQVRRPWPRLRV